MNRYCRKVGDAETGTTGILPVAASKNWDNGHLARYGWQKVLRLQRAGRPLSQFSVPLANGRDARCPSSPCLSPTGGTPVVPAVCGMSSPTLRQYQIINSLIRLSITRNLQIVSNMHSKMPFLIQIMSNVHSKSPFSIQVSSVMQSKSPFSLHEKEVMYSNAQFITKADDGRGR